jgi:type I restriction enzyme, S subunit
MCSVTETELAMVWPSASLAEVTVAIRDGTHGTLVRVEDGVPLLSAKNIASDGRVVWDQTDSMIRESDYEAICRGYRLAPGDLLLTIVGSLGRRALYAGGKVAFQRSVAFIRSDPAKLAPTYLFHATGHADFQKQLIQRSNATAQAGLYLGELGQTVVPLPPLHDQRRIAAILDTLDEAIRKTEDIIAKLKLTRQGLLHDLLTRGVDEGGRLRPSLGESPDLFKDSPVGMVPKSWDCSSVDSAFDMQPGLTLGPHRVPRNSPFPYLRVANVFKGYLDLSDIASLNARPFEVAHQLLRTGDLLLVEGHANIEEIGRVALADERVAGFTYQNHLLRLRPHTLEPDYCELWLNGPWVRSYWRRMCSTSSGLNTINQHTLKAIPVPIPSREERGRITATAELHSTRVSTESAVLAKYRSLKAGLMDDLLSGRVRLRGSAEPRA